MDNRKENSSANASTSNIQIDVVDEDHEEAEVDIEGHHIPCFVHDAPLLAQNAPPQDYEIPDEGIPELIGLFEDLKLVIPSTVNRGRVTRNLILREAHSLILVLFQKHKDMTEREREMTDRLRQLTQRLKDLTKELEELTET